MAEFNKGEVTSDAKVMSTSDRNGTYITFEPDNVIFKNFLLIASKKRGELKASLISSKNLTNDELKNSLKKLKIKMIVLD